MAWYTAEVQSGFTAVRRLINFEGQCSQLHGHDFRVKLVVGSEHLNDAGLVVDYYWLRTELDTLIQKMSFQCLNELDDFREISPSCEVLAHWFFQKISQTLTAFPTVRLTHVTLWENDNFCSTYSET